MAKLVVEWYNELWLNDYDKIETLITNNKWMIEKHKIKGKTTFKMNRTVANFAEINFFQKLLREEEEPPNDLEKVAHLTI